MPEPRRRPVRAHGPYRYRPRGPENTSTPQDIAPELVRHTQAYLECRRQRRRPDRQQREAWDQFYRACDPLIRRLAARCGAPPADLDECAQEVWAVLLRRLRDFIPDPGRGRFVTWLFTLVRSKAADLLRRRARHPTAALPAAGAALCGPGADPAAEYERGRRRARLEAALAELRRRASAASYRVLYMRSVEGRSVPEIAAALDLKPGQVRARQHRMRRQLCRLVRRHAGRDVLV